MADNPRLNIKDSIQELLNAVTQLAISDYLKAIRDGMLSKERECAEYLTMKNDVGEYVFPWHKINYNVHHGYDVFLYEHLTHLPNKWNEDIRSNKQHITLGKPSRLNYRCPICHVGEVYGVFVNNTHCLDTFFMHRCQKCRFYVYSLYSDIDEDSIRKRNVILQTPLKALTDEIIQLEIDYVNNDPRFNSEQKEERAKEIKTVWRTKYGSHAR